MPDSDVCTEVVAGKCAIAEVGLVSFLLREAVDELASFVGLAETTRVLALLMAGVDILATLKGLVKYSISQSVEAGGGTQTEGFGSFETSGLADDILE